ncbi:MAG: PKD domain-containing protein, partial [Bacteroidota bacterium]
MKKRPKTISNYLSKVSKRLFVILLGLIITLVAQAQEEPTISTCTGDQDQCLTGPIANICVNINLNGFARPIDRFEIIWGDDSEDMVIPANGTITNILHDFDLNEFFFSCDSENSDIGIRLNTYLVGEDRPLNNGFFPTFLNPPRADFELTREIICVGNETCLDLGPACPRNNYEIVSIDYGDGTSDTLTCHTYDRVGTYTVSLTLGNDCGEDTKTQTVTVIEEPVAKIFSAISGAANPANPHQICVGTEVKLDGDTLSQNESNFEWRVLESGGFSWIRDDNRNQNRPTIPDLGIIFNREGTYTIVLEVDNACNQPDRDTLVCEVIDASAFTLNEQEDACMSLDYSPVPIEEGVIYTIDGAEVNVADFPVTLSVGQHRVEATNPSNICVAGSLVDTFEVFAVEKAQIRQADTTICSVDGMLQLTSDPPNAEWRINGELFNGVIDPESMMEGRQVITYGLAPCVTNDTIFVEIIQAGIAFNGKKEFCLIDTSSDLQATPAGGTYSGVGITDSLQGIFDPQVAGEGRFTIYYTIEGDNLTACSNQDSIEIIVSNLTGAFEVTNCNGLALSFAMTDSLTSNFDNITWNFGDGNTSTRRTPSHTYNSAGDYLVSATIELTNSSGETTCEEVIQRTITLAEQPNAGFSIAKATDNCAELDVTIIDASTGSNLIYAWNFGNGEESSASNPENIIYDAIENDTLYTITLQVGNDCATSEFSVDVPVRARAKARFGTRFDRYCSGESIELSNNARGNPDRYQWFKNGELLTTDSLPPVVQHLTEVADSIEICLVVENECALDTACRKILIEPTDVKAFYNTEDSIACVGEPFCFTNFSNTDNISFDFGDGTRTDSIEFCHTYAAPGTYPVVIKAFGCGFDSLASAITVFPKPLAVLVAPALICPKTEVRLAITSNQPETLQSFNWFFEDSLQANTSVVNRQFDSTRTYQVNWSVTSNDGCTQSSTELLTIQPRPVANFRVSDTVFCEKEEVLISGDREVGETCFYQFGNGNTSNDCTPNFSYETAGVYTIEQIVENNFTCTDTVKQTVVVRAVPQPNFSIANEILCSSDTISLQNLTLDAESYQWIFNNQDTIFDNNPSYVFPTSGSFPVTLTAFNNGQCSATVEQSVIITAKPEAGINIEDTNFCANEPINFNTIAANATEVRWDFGDEKVSFTATATNSYEADGDYRIQLIQTNDNCVDTANLDITINEAVDFSTLITPVLCNGANTGSIALNNNAGTAPFSFIWSNGVTDGEVSSLVAGNYGVTVTDNNLCQWESELTISEPDRIQATASNQQNVDCFGEATGSLEVVIAGGTPDYQLNWSNGNQSSALQNLVAGAYELTVTDGNDCEATATF